MSKYLHAYFYRSKLADSLVWLANLITKTEMRTASDTYRRLDCLTQDENGKFHQYAWSVEAIEAWVEQCELDKKPIPTIAELIDMSAWHSVDEPGIVDDIRRSLAVKGVELEER